MKLFYRKLLKVFWKSKTYRIVQQIVDLEIADQLILCRHPELISFIDFIITQVLIDFSLQE